MKVLCFSLIEDETLLFVGRMKTGSRSDPLRIWLLTFFAWELVMCRMWQDSSGEGISLGSSGVCAFLSWVARGEGPAQPGFLTFE